VRSLRDHAELVEGFSLLIGTLKVVLE
jgi:hypothetical protein